MASTAALPSGTVTLFFTDIQGSTQLWDSFPDEMRAALAVHDRLVGEAVHAVGGAVVKNTGDGIFAAFADARTAIAAAIDAQSRIVAHDWDPAVGTLEVRMALHTDSVDSAGGDYHGPAVNRTARIEAAGHGGQILISDATRLLAGAALPDGVKLLDLGSHRLRGLSRPERIHQLVVPGLRASFPPLQTASVAVGHLPEFATSFVGREAEVASLAGRLADPECRVLTAVGPGGIGKTRLAVEATRLAAERAGKVGHFVPLVSVSNSVGIVREIADTLAFQLDVALGIGETDQILDLLATQHMILVLDNFEHLTAEAALVSQLVAAAPHLTVVVTSRERLGIASEWVHEVPGLSVDGGADAVSLFVDRARRAGADTDAIDRGDVAALCRRLGGMPLAIELAAAWTPTLPVTDIIAEVDQNLDLLSRSSPDVPERHRSIRVAFDQSWARLPDGLKEAYPRIAVFSAPFTRAAADSVAGAGLPVLAELMNRSLLRRADLGTFDLHPLLREFGLEQLGDRREEAEESHGRYFVRRLLEREPLLRGSIEQLEVKDEIAAELLNLRQATRWAVNRLAPDEFVAMLHALHPFYFIHSWVEAVDHYGELASAIEDRLGVADAADDPRYLWAQTYAMFKAAFLARADTAGPVLSRLLPAWESRGGVGLATCLMALGIVADARGDLDEARTLLERSAEVGFEGDVMLDIDHAAWYGWVLYEQGDATGAERVFRRGLALAEAEHTILRAYLLSKLGLAVDALGKHEEAAEYHHEGREMFVKSGDIAGQGYTLSRLSSTYWEMGDYVKAKRYGEDGLEKFEEVNHRWGVAVSWCRVGFANLGLSDVAAARRAFTTALELAITAEMRNLAYYALTGLGRVLLAEGRVEAAAMLLGHAAQARPNPYADLALETLSELGRGDGDAMEPGMTFDEAVRLARQTS